MTNLAAALIVYLNETDGASLSMDGVRAKNILIAHRRITFGSAKLDEKNLWEREVYQAAVKTLLETKQNV